MIRVIILGMENWYDTKDRVGRRLYVKLQNGSDVNKIYAQTCEINFSSRKQLEYCGFSIDAKLRDHHLYKNRFYDDYIYSILRADRIKLEEKCR